VRLDRATVAEADADAGAIDAGLAADADRRAVAGGAGPAAAENSSSATGS
jgi:hypothetical protein